MYPMLNIAHRGASGYAPENTLAAFRKAAEMGAAAIETDLRITFDGHAVAMHDANARRTTGEFALVGSRTLKEIRALNAGALFRGPRSLRRQRVPTLREILQFTMRAKLMAFLELKSQPDQGLEPEVIRGIRAARASARCVVISFNENALRIVREVDPEITVGFLREKIGRDSILRALSLQAKYVLGLEKHLTGEIIAEIRGTGIKAIAWTVNRPARMRELIRAGIDGIITDYPDRLDKVIRESETIRPPRISRARKPK
jgi:glycerophosphoryl diester phosphodiesterase